MDVVLIIWLASYPKSGNTWLRIFLANYLSGSDDPFDIRKLESVRMNLQDTNPNLWGGLEVTEDSQHRNREYVFRRFLNEYPGVHFCKTHNGRYEVMGYPLIPPSVTAGAISVVRNPVDVAASYAGHFRCSQSQAVRSLSSGQKGLLNGPFVQVVGSWSDHVDSWTNGGICTIRYEDLPGDFGKVCDYLGLPQDERFDKAVKYSDISLLKQQEDKAGFPEAISGKFFGRTKKRLSRRLAERVKRDHHEVMEKYGYI